MTKRMLIDASHAEETRVVVLDGNRLEDFDVETSTKRQLKGNIYLAKVIRVEPSLQAAFVEYGGNRHGFLAFSEIHPDYYQIPVADRQRLLDMEAEEARREEEEEDRAAGHPQPARRAERTEPAEPVEAPEAEATAETTDESGVTAEVVQEQAQEEPAAPPANLTGETTDESGAALPPPFVETASPSPASADSAEQAEAPAQQAEEPVPATPPEPPAAETSDESGATNAIEPPNVEPDEEKPEPRSRPRAQPLIIEPETLSGPVETADAPSELPETTAEAALSAGQAPAEAGTEGQSTPAAEEPPAAETGDESGATAATLEQAGTERPHAHDESEQHDPADERMSEQPQPERDDEDEPFSDDEPERQPPPETIGGESEGDERGERRLPPRFLRNYKIQEVIKRRQIMLVQVVKEERGTKGAALTTYISLAGRFSVLMPNSPRGGGISRKITSGADRRRLKEVISELDLPKGMGLIVRTAGANRPKPEIKRDCEYLLRLWDDIREQTLKSVAPALVYEEASLIKRAIRDVYSRDIDEIAVDGEEGWRQAHDFMRMLMPSHAKKVQLWRDGGQPLFARYQVEAQLDNMLLPTVQLRSGGYLVINQTEALVAIDVNSGRSTRERNVEETALRTNLEAADEAARQLRLRDLAGLIVIDFIDMESRKHNAMVEKRLKEALKNDRARIQVGHISHFGLLEMSRQRLRPSLAETSFIPCPHCGGTGHIRSTESAALHVLRGIEEEGSKRRAAEIVVHVATQVALYILNHKRDRLNEIELRYAMRVTLAGDDRQIEPQYRIDRLRPQTAAPPPAVTPETVRPAAPPPLPSPEPEEEPVLASDDEDEGENEEAAETGTEPQGEGGEISAEEAERRRRRRRRRRRGGRREDQPGQSAQPDAEAAPAPAEPAPEGEAPSAEEPPPPIDAHIEGVPEHLEPAGGEEDEDRSRRRGRRGGRRRRREPGQSDTPLIEPGAEQPDLPSYAGPTPANPFGGHAFDIFDMLEQAENYSPAAAPSAEPTEAAGNPSPEPAPSAPQPSQAINQEIVNSSAPEPAAEEAVGQEPAAGPPVQVPEPEAVPAETAEPAAEQPEQPIEVESPPEPAIKPIIIGSADEPPAERKRGWWRR